MRIEFVIALNEDNYGTLISSTTVFICLRFMKFQVKLSTKIVTATKKNLKSMKRLHKQSNHLK